MPQLIKVYMMNKRLITVCAVLVSIYAVSAQNFGSEKKIWNGKAMFNVQNKTYRELPKSIDFKGVFIEALSWNDANGEQLLVLSKNPFYPYAYNKDCKGPVSDSCFGGELFAYLFVKKNDVYILKWRIYDFLDQWTDGDFHINFIPNSLSISDLNEDQIAEIILGYDYACRLEANSPGTMKFLAYEGQTKYALRGKTVLDVETENLKNYTASENLSSFYLLNKVMEQRWVDYVHEANR